MISRPVLSSELRKKARQARTYAFRTVFLLLILLVGTLIISENPRLQIDRPAMRARLSKQLYFGLVLVMGAAVTFLAPAYAGGIIASERERQTLSTILASDLSSIEIVGDKLVAQISLIGLNMLGVLPLCFGCLMLGGVSWWQLVG